MVRFIRLNLEHDGFQVISAYNGREALEQVRSTLPNLVLLDVMMPDLDGFEVLERIREQSSIPVIMLTAKGEEADIVAGLELGADDYITKPFSPRVLVARVRSVLRRNLRGKVKEFPEETKVLRIHDLVIHPGRREVLTSGKPVQLTFTEFGILNYLAQRPGWVFTRGQIVDAVRGEDYFVTDRSVDVQIVGLRKKLGDAGKYIETVRGVGYRFKG